MRRRQFIHQSSFALLGAVAGNLFYKNVAPSDKVRLAVIGTGNMGNNHIGWFADLPEVDVVALCDVDKNHLDESLKSLQEKKPGLKVDGYADFRRVLERQDIDAISCATPDHWHAQVAMLACEAGKDVYGEKPLAYSVREGQRMLYYQEKNKRIFQLGTQIHAGDNYHRVAEIIQSGVLGAIHTVRLWKTVGDRRLQATPLAVLPAGLDWDMWCGPAPLVPYVPERSHLTFRSFLDYSGGVYADFWCHIADIVFWALQPQGLTKISAVGQPVEGYGDVPGEISVDFIFDRLNVHWTSTPPDIPGAAGKHIGAYFEGEKGQLLCDYDTRQITLNGETVNDLVEIPTTIPRSPGHQQNFIDAVKTRKAPESNLAYARQMTLPMHLGLISYRLSRPLTWDAASESFVNDPVANALLYRQPREKWRLIE